MKGLTILLLIIPVLLNAKEIQTIVLPVGGGYYIFATCQETETNDSEIFLKLGDNTGNEHNSIFLTGPQNGCDAISQDDFDGDGILDISITYGSQLTSSQRIYLIDIDRKLIIDSGIIPVESLKLDNGSYQYETISYGSMFRSNYVFVENKVVEKTTTQLVFDGKVCLNNKGEVERYTDCPNGMVATQKNPICFEREYKNHFKLIPLENCLINKAEVFGLHD